jgi:hypothetical protein
MKHEQSARNNEKNVDTFRGDFDNPLRSGLWSGSSLPARGNRAVYSRVSATACVRAPSRQLPRLPRHPVNELSKDKRQRPVPPWWSVRAVHAERPAFGRSRHPATVVRAKAARATVVRATVVRATVVRATVVRATVVRATVVRAKAAGAGRRDSLRRGVAEKRVGNKNRATDLTTNTRIEREKSQGCPPPRKIKR